MDNDQVTHIELDLDLGAEPIAGCIWTQSRIRIRFCGMLELMGLLDMLRGTAPERAVGGPGTDWAG